MSACRNPEGRRQPHFLDPAWEPKSEMPDIAYFQQAEDAAKYLAERAPQAPQIGLVLGSGLGEVVRSVEHAVKIPYSDIPHFPRPTVEGHGGTLHLGQWKKVPVAVLEGRMHLYEGYDPAQVVFPARVLVRAGVKALVVTCAAGGISRLALPGSFMIFSDHLNLQGGNPLVGSHDPRWGPRFIDMSEAYDGRLRQAALKAGRALGLKCFEGVYASLLGPSYETPAEIRMLRRLGADVVGMSTVPEVIAARQCGLRVVAVATISNRAAGLSRRPLSHQEVLKVGERASRGLARLLERIIELLREGIR